MESRRITSALLLAFMTLFGVVETAASALASPLAEMVIPGIELREPELCPMHAGEPCCCGMDPAKDTAEDVQMRMAAGCLSSPPPVPVVFPVSPLFRFLPPETTSLGAVPSMALETFPFVGPALPAMKAPDSPPPQFSRI